MFKTPFYNQTIRNTIVAFGSMFSKMRIVRDGGAGKPKQTLEIPIAYSQKEKWLQEIDGNPKNERGVYAALPRMGFEIVGYSFDPSRKLGRSQVIHCTGDDGRKQVFAPVPYNIDISLYFATKTQEDALQILEQILPQFAPDYTLNIMSVPELNLRQDVPFVLNSVSVVDEYEGDLSERRFVVHTIDFTAKINLFNGVNSVSLIHQAEVDVSQNPQFDYTARQETPTSEIVETILGNF